MADRFYSYCVGLGERVISVNQPLAWAAAQISLQSHLSMTDAIIYATARAHQAELVTSDGHFSGLPGVTLL
ncbi:MAG TPA: PIN domain-containing protein [Candidatus Acidoferrales bacterium]|nr:PIN domain-containing protein [Candidatus Acidoferrales bacterium]